MTEFRAPVWDIVGDHRYLLYGTTLPGAEGTVLPAGKGDRWLIGLQHDGDEAGDPPALDEMRRRIELAAGVPGLPIRIERSAPFTSGAQLADRFRVGNIFLVGDAAHRITPRGELA